MNKIKRKSSGGRQSQTGALIKSNFIVARKPQSFNRYYRTCPYCGANLDPEERCDCEE